MALRIAAFLAFSGLLTLAAAANVACGSDGRSFPLHIDSKKHYPTDREGHPFFMQGEAAWSLIADLKDEEAYLYLEDRKARGFNTVLVSLLEHRFSRNAPANAYRDRPFAYGADFAVPNEAYFAHADRILQKACELGFLVLLTPAYIGFGGGDDGWYQEMSEAGTEKLRAYGRFLGKRYGGFGNIVWVHGGDYDPADKKLVTSVAAGILEEAPDALGTAHNGPETAPLEFWGYEPWLQLNNVYTYQPVVEAALREHDLARGVPFFLMESAYEFEHGADEYRVRVQAYQAVLSGAFGHIFGNNPIWHFDGPGLMPSPMEWMEALDSPGTKSMEVLLDFVLSTKWWLFEPDSEGRLLVKGMGAGMERAVASMASDFSLAVVYMPESDGVTVDLARLSRSKVHARWRDPTTGDVTVVDGSPFPAIRVRFTPPGRNEHGYSDWILELVPEQTMEHIQ